MVEFKDANPEERAVNLCNSGLMAVRSADLFRLLDRIGNDNAAGEYYLPDIVMLAAADGATRRHRDGAGEVAGVNSRAELSVVESDWQVRRARARWPKGLRSLHRIRYGSRMIPVWAATW